MKLAVSNLAWEPQDSPAVYAQLQRRGFTGLELAPTKLFPEDPYAHGEEAAALFAALRADYGLEPASMQSIWYGQKGNIFRSAEEREALLAYTFRAVDFAAAIGCGNLVFGNPKARAMGPGHREEEVYPFFRAISDYAAQRGTCMALEPNPPIYGTDFITDTRQAFDFCRRSGCEALRVNLDLGTLLWQGEELELAPEDLALVHHIHISEPWLRKLEPRPLHRRLRDLDYGGWFSVEMGLQERIEDLFEVIDYVAEVFAP